MNILKDSTKYFFILLNNRLFPFYGHGYNSDIGFIPFK